MTERLRAVLDTNVIVSATISRNPTSPTRELLDRWERDEFSLLFCEALSDELIETLITRSISPAEVAQLSATLWRLAVWVDVPPEAIQPVLSDPDDDIVLACAVQGSADYIVTYDPHFDALGGEYRGVKIVRALPFLWTVRDEHPPEGNAEPDS